MVVTDFETESVDSLTHADDFRIFNVSLNCRGYVSDSSSTELRRLLKRNGRARVRFDDSEVCVVTCPKFAGQDFHVCMFPGYNYGARKHLCSNGEHVHCATYDLSINQ